MILGVPAQTGSGSAIASATQWMEQLLTGNLATSIAIIAVAAVGFLALSGRLAVRRALVVVLGCFILFGARSIANGLMGAAQGEGGTVTAAAPPPPAYPKLTAPSAQPRSEPFDPYAGAAVPPTK